MSSFGRRLRALLFAWAAACGVAVWADARSDAEAEEDQQEQPYQLEDRVEYVYVKDSYIPTSNTIATKLPLPLQLTPANVGAVSGPLLREQDAVVLGDALINVSGLNVQAGSGVHDFFLIRGFDSLNSGLVLTDGAAEPEVTFYHLYNVEAVEVLKGPGGFLYGSNPLAGVVNIIRKQPVPSNFFTFSGSIGSFDTAEGSFDWNLSNQSKDRSFRLNGFWLESDNYRDDKQSSHFAASPSFAWRLSDSTTVNLNLEYVDAEYKPDSGLPLVNNEIPDVPRERSYQSPFDRSDQTLYRLQVDLETRVNDTLTLRSKTYYRDLDWTTDGTLFTGVFPDILTGALDVSRVLTLLDDRQRFSGNQFEAVLSLSSGPVRHELLAGLEVARLADDFDIDVALLPDIDLLDPVETAQEPLFVLPDQSLSGDARSIVIAPYLVDQVKLSDQFQLLLGARHDHIDYEDSVNPVDRDDSKTSPMAGFLYAPNKSLSLYVNGGRSFAPASPRVVGDRKPEESAQIEVGLKKKFLRGKVQTNFAVYQLDRENIAIPDDNGITQQAGDQRSRGFEVDLAAEPRARLHTFFAYAYNDAELTRFTEQVIVGFDPVTFEPILATLDRSGNTPAFAPEHLLSFWVSHTFSNGLGIGGGGRHFSDQFVAEDNLFEIDGATIFDATVFYNSSRWKIKLNFKNLTDKEYETRGFGSTSVTPANPFSAYLGFEYRLQ